MEAEGRGEREAALRALEGRLGHRFLCRALLETALTHRSAGAPHNERLEFLGDGLLDGFSAELLYHRFPEADEGRLTRLRAHLVQGTSLARLAGGLGLGPLLRLGPGELKSGGRRRASILAGAVEALVGAVHLDGGCEASRALVRRLLEPQLERLGEGLDPEAVLKDPKTRLQEWLQGRGRPLPVYRLLETQGKDHARNFRVRCELVDAGLGAEGRGSSRRAAEQEAARRVLERLEGGDEEEG